MVARHADKAVPFVLEHHLVDLREERTDVPQGPAAMDRRTRAAERTDAADNEAAGIVHAEGTEHGPRVECSLPFRKERRTLWLSGAVATWE